MGGSYASVALIQAKVIENHAWLTMPQFIDIFTISHMTPGSNGINAATLKVYTHKTIQQLVDAIDLI